MPIKMCSEPRCPKFATSRGNCDEHRRQYERDRSRRRREAAKDRLGRTVYKTKQWEQLRRQVLFEQPLCAICGDRIIEEIDHIIPLSQGGAPYDRNNLRGLCRACHIKRHQWTGVANL
jgi:5-methylcytosine-specific restriction endonuclease McrA